MAVTANSKLARFLDQRHDYSPTYQRTSAADLLQSGYEAIYVGSRSGVNNSQVSRSLRRTVDRDQYRCDSVMSLHTLLASYPAAVSCYYSCYYTYIQDLYSSLAHSEFQSLRCFTATISQDHYQVCLSHHFLNLFNPNTILTFNVYCHIIIARFLK